MSSLALRPADPGQDLGGAAVASAPRVRCSARYRRGTLAVAGKRGRQRAEQRGREDGLRKGIEELCGVLGSELTEQRRRELASLDAAGLAALLARLSQHKSWA